MTIKTESSQDTSNTPKRMPTWAEVIGGESLFKDCITTDLNEVENAWTKLSKNKVFTQLLSLPAVIHYAFKDSLEKILDTEDLGFLKKVANNIEKRELALSERREQFGTTKAYLSLTSGIIIQLLTGFACIALVIYFVISNPSSFLSVILILFGLVISLSGTQKISKLLDLPYKLFR